MTFSVNRTYHHLFSSSGDYFTDAGYFYKKDIVVGNRQAYKRLKLKIPNNFASLGFDSRKACAEHYLNLLESGEYIEAEPDRVYDNFGKAIYGIRLKSST